MENSASSQFSDDEFICSPAPENLEFSYKSGQKLWSLLWNQENLIDKKRRWLLAIDPNYNLSRKRQKKRKRPKFLSTKYLRESDVRNDEVSYDKLRAIVERSFGQQNKVDFKHHVVKEYLHLLDVPVMHDDSSAQLRLRVHYLLNKLNNQALLMIADIVTINTIDFRKNRVELIKVIKEHLPKFFDNPDDYNLRRLSEVINNPESFELKNLELSTPITSELLTFIQNALHDLGSLSIRDMRAVLRKLEGKKSALHFPLNPYSGKREQLAERVRSRFSKSLSEFTCGKELPKEWAKALSIICMSRKLRLGCWDGSVFEFCPHPPEIFTLQFEILKSVQLLSTISYQELDTLKQILDPNARVSEHFFRNALRNYLEECLFECDENLPCEALEAIAFIKHKSPQNLCFQNKEEEVEATLNLSSYLKTVASCKLNDDSAEAEDIDSESLGSDLCTMDNDMVLSDTNYLSISAGDEYQHMEDCASTGVCYLEDANDNKCNVQDADQRAQMNSVIGPLLLEGSSSDLQMKKGICSIDFNEISDDTAIVAHKLIGQTLLLLARSEGHKVEEPVRSYLADGAPSPLDVDGRENCSEYTVRGYLLHAVRNMLPSLPESCVKKIKRVMELS